MDNADRMGHLGSQNHRWTRDEVEPIRSGVSEAHRALPVVHNLPRGQFLFSSGAIAAALLLLGCAGFRVVTQVGAAHWWVPLAIVSGIASADFLSGLVHWGADTWGRDDCPIIGPRLLVPFRVHHINPDDFLRRRFVDTNGEVAVIAIPALTALLAIPLETTWGAPASVYGLALCAIGSLTNQIHQWAHMPAPPRAIVLMQRGRIFLGRRDHAEHHARPYDCGYCITTGWCNRPLEAIGFFRRLERAITAVTGVQPRRGDRGYEARYGAAAAESCCD